MRRSRYTRKIYNLSDINAARSRTRDAEPAWGDVAQQAAPAPSSSSAANACAPAILAPEKVTWNGDDCENVSIAIPAAEQVPHYSKLLDPAWLNGIFLTPIIGKDEACKRIAARDNWYAKDSATAAAMFPMVKDNNGNVFYILTETTDLFKAIKDQNLWGKNAVFVAVNRPGNESWMRGGGYGERLRAMFVPNHSEHLRKYAAEHLDNQGGLRFNWEEMQANSWNWTRDHGAGEEVANQLLGWYKDGGKRILSETFYDTMQVIEKSGKQPYTFVFLCSGAPKTAAGTIVSVLATAISSVVSVFTAGLVSIPPNLIAGFLNAVIDFAEGRGSWDKMLLAAMDVGVTIALSTKTGEKPIFGEMTQKIIKEAYTVASTLVKTKNLALAGKMIADSFIKLGQTGAIKLPSYIPTGNGSSMPVLDVVMNMGFESVRKEVQAPRELAANHLTNMAKAATDFRLATGSTIAGLKKGVEQTEKMFNAAVDTLEKINSSGGSSLMDDLLTRNSFLFSLNPGMVSAVPNMGNLAAAALNVPLFKGNDADTPESQAMLAGIAAGFNFPPSAFDQFQFNALAKSAEEALKKAIPFSIPTTILPDRADDYRIKIEKCYNLAITDNSDRPTQVSVPETPSGGDAGNAANDAGGGQGANNLLPASVAPDGTVSVGGKPIGTKDANGVVRNAGGKVVGSITPDGMFAPLATTAAAKKRRAAAQDHWFKKGLQIPPYIRSIGGTLVYCAKKVTKKTSKEEEAKKAEADDIRACMPFLGDGFTKPERRALAEYFLQDYMLRRGGTLADAALAVTGAKPHPLGLQIACVAEGWIAAKASEAAVRQTYDNMPNERMREHREANFGDEGWVHFTKYSRGQNPDGTPQALAEGQKDYSAMFVWDVVEEAGRKCFGGWKSRNFIRNAKILDAEGVFQSGFYTLNDPWLGADEGGILPGAIFVRLVAGAPHCGIVVKTDGDFFFTAEANALQNTGEGTDSAVQRFQRTKAEAAEWKFFHVWRDSVPGALRLPVAGRCCVVPDAEQSGSSPVIARPAPSQALPDGAVGGWLPTDDDERRDPQLRALRERQFFYHAPQSVTAGAAETGVFWKAFKRTLAQQLFPVSVPKELRELGYELNPDPMNADRTRYEYKPEGLLAFAYRRSKGVPQKKRIPVSPRKLLRRARALRGLGDALSDTLESQIECVANKMPRDKAGVIKLYNATKPLQGDKNIGGFVEPDPNTCAAFAWSFFAKLRDCMGVGTNCPFVRTYRVFDQKGALNNLSLFHGAVARGWRVDKTPAPGAIFVRPRTYNALGQKQDYDSLVKNGIQYAQTYVTDPTGKKRNISGGHAGVVLAVSDATFRVIDANNSDITGLGSLKGVADASHVNEYEVSHDDIPAGAKNYFFLHCEDCLKQHAQPDAKKTDTSFCCPSENIVGCAECTGGGTRNADGECDCPSGSVKDPANPCNCVQPQENRCDECTGGGAKNEDGDCECPDGKITDPKNPCNCVDKEPKKPDEDPSCDEPEPPRDPECGADGWIRKLPGHVPKDNYKYSGACWYCQKQPPKKVACPEKFPSAFGTGEGWERVGAGDPCADQSYNYFKTGTGECCWRKRKPGGTTPPPKTTIPPPPKTYTVPPPPEGDCEDCAEPCETDGDLVAEYERVYNDWENYAIYPAFYHTLEKRYFAKIGKEIVPVEGDEVEVEDVEPPMPSVDKSVEKSVRELKEIVLRTQEGETGGGYDELAKKMDDLSRKVDLLALKKGEDPKTCQDLREIRTLVESKSNETFTERQLVERFKELETRLEKSDTSQIESKLRVMDANIERLMKIVETSARPASSQAVAQVATQAASQAASQASAQAAAQAATQAASQAAAQVSAQVEALKTELKTPPADNTDFAEKIARLERTVERLEKLTSTPGTNAKEIERTIQNTVTPLLVKVENLRRETANAYKEGGATSNVTVDTTDFQKTVKEFSALVEKQKELTQCGAKGGAAVRNRLDLLQKIVEDVAARASCNVDVSGMERELAELKKTLSKPSAVTTEELDNGTQSVVAAVQELPHTYDAVRKNHDIYEEQIAVLRAELERLRSERKACEVRKQEPERARKTIQFMNLLNYYRQQCDTCTSCANAGLGGF